MTAGAEVNLRTPEGTPLEIVLQQAYPDPALVRELVLAGADLDLKGGWVPKAHQLRGADVPVCAPPSGYDCGVPESDQTRTQPKPLQVVLDECSDDNCSDH